jgi:hypothetical protein
MEGLDLLRIFSCTSAVERRWRFGVVHASMEIATVTEIGPFQRFQRSIAWILLVPLAIARLNVYTLKIDR